MHADWNRVRAGELCGFFPPRLHGGFHEVYPLLPLGRASPLSFRGTSDSFKGHLGVARYSQVDRVVPSDLGRVYVDLDYLDPLRENGPAARGYAADLASNVEHQVGLLNNCSRGFPGVPARNTYGERMILGDGTFSGERRSHRNRKLLGQRLDRFPCLGRNDPAAGNEYRSF